MRKILEIEQKNTSLLREIVHNQLRLEDSIEEMFNNISDTIVSLKEQKSVVSDHDNKKDKKKAAVFKVYLFYFIVIIFHLIYN